MRISRRLQHYRSDLTCITNDPLEREGETNRRKEGGKERKEKGKKDEKKDRRRKKEKEKKEEKEEKNLYLFTFFMFIQNFHFQVEIFIISHLYTRLK